MVWKDDVYTIVMTTGLVEKGRDKCHLYWPDTVGRSIGHGPITIECIASEQGAGYIKSTHKLSDGSGQTKVCEHYWYNSWPVKFFRQYLYVVCVPEYCRCTNHSIIR